MTVHTLNCVFNERICFHIFTGVLLEWEILILKCIFPITLKCTVCLKRHLVDIEKEGSAFWNYVLIFGRERIGRLPLIGEPNSFSDTPFLYSDDPYPSLVLNDSLKFGREV